MTTDHYAAAERLLASAETQYGADRIAAAGIHALLAAIPRPIRVEVSGALIAPAEHRPVTPPVRASAEQIVYRVLTDAEYSSEIPGYRTDLAAGIVDALIDRGVLHTCGAAEAVVCTSCRGTRLAEPGVVCEDCGGTGRTVGGSR